MKEKVIYFLEKPIFLSNEKEKMGCVSLDYSSKQTFSEALRILKKTPAKGVNIYTNGQKGLWKMFKRNFKIIEAAGGVVINKKNQKLFIKRLGHWDLPKGKLEVGESFDLAAKREVEEETGILISKVEEKITNTYHIYLTESGKPILKKVVWYEMLSLDKSIPVPQKEEGIDEVKWLSDKHIEDLQDKMYRNILYLLSRFYNKVDSKISSK